LRRAGRRIQAGANTSARSERVARALLRAIRSDRAEVFAPAWIRLPARLKGSLPGVYRRLALRFGQAGRGAGAA